MKPRTVDGYISLGTLIWYLTEARLDSLIYESPAHANGWDWHIKRVLYLIEEYELIVTLKVAQPLKELVGDWSKIRSTALADGEVIEDWEKKQKLSQSQADVIKSNARLVQTVLHSESGTKSAYIISDGKYSSEKLLQDVSALMPKGVFENLPTIAKFDLKQVGRALALDLPTAAAFHVLRATEEVVRDLYLTKVKLKKNRLKEPLLWGPMTTQLGQLSRPVPNELLAQLDNIRIHFRNPTTHPDKLFDQDEAEALFALCIDVIHRIHKYLGK